MLKEHIELLGERLLLSNWNNKLSNIFFQNKRELLKLGDCCNHTITLVGKNAVLFSHVGRMTGVIPDMSPAIILYLH